MRSSSNLRTGPLYAAVATVTGMVGRDIKSYRRFRDTTSLCRFTSIFRRPLDSNNVYSNVCGRCIHISQEFFRNRRDPVHFRFQDPLGFNKGRHVPLNVPCDWQHGNAVLRNKSDLRTSTIPLTRIASRTESDQDPFSNYILNPCTAPPSWFTVTS
jgi:hypothetical protein